MTDNTGILIELWRQRQDLRSAEQRLHLQSLSLCRRISGGDKVAAVSLLKAVKAQSEIGAVAVILTPYLDALGTIEKAICVLELSLRREARKHPLWKAWAVDVRGMAEVSFAGLIGEAGRPITDYRTVSALWKRFGLAVIDGARQRRTKTTEEALTHGYSPRRRAFAYVLATNLMRSQREEDPYRRLYDLHKPLELAKGLTPIHAHNRALRRMSKELLKAAWVAAAR